MALACTREQAAPMNATRADQIHAGLSDLAIRSTWDRHCGEACGDDDEGYMSRDAEPGAASGHGRFVQYIHAEKAPRRRAQEQADEPCRGRNPDEHRNGVITGHEEEADACHDRASDEAADQMGDPYEEVDSAWRRQSAQEVPRERDRHGRRGDE